MRSRKDTVPAWLQCDAFVPRYAVCCLSCCSCCCSSSSAGRRWGATARMKQGQLLCMLDITRINTMPGTPMSLHAMSMPSLAAKTAQLPVTTARTAQVTAQVTAQPCPRWQINLPSMQQQRGSRAWSSKQSTGKHCPGPSALSGSASPYRRGKSSILRICGSDVARARAPQRR